MISRHTRAALEEVCARGDLQRARELYAPDFVDHRNALEFRGHEGIARSVALYRALFSDPRIDVVDQVSDGDRVVSRWTLQGTHGVRRDQAELHPQRGRLARAVRSQELGGLAAQAP